MALAVAKTLSVTCQTALAKKCSERWEEVLALHDKLSCSQCCQNYNLIDAVSLIAMTLHWLFKAFVASFTAVFLPACAYHQNAAFL